MSAVKLTPEVVAAINEFFSADSLDQLIRRLADAEEGMQKAAYEDYDFAYMFRSAYEVKLIREQLEKLEKILGYEPERD